MKSNQYGAWAEQCRFKAGFLSFGERNAKVANKELNPDHKCGNCTELKTDHGTRCKKGDFATRVNCVCNAFTQRSAQDI